MYQISSHISRKIYEENCYVRLKIGMYMYRYKKRTIIMLDIHMRDDLCWFILWILVFGDAFVGFQSRDCISSKIHTRIAVWSICIFYLWWILCLFSFVMLSRTARNAKQAKTTKRTNLVHSGLRTQAWHGPQVLKPSPYSHSHIWIHVKKVFNVYQV